MSETIDLRGRNFLAEENFSAAELTYLIDLAEHLKRERHAGHEGQRLNGRGIALIFEKTSTRT
ncbi:MAG: ornithine carbamoyltransferase subunit F, partial [Actinomycetia bacterium]|nr:ornithine carbamoyltransferase subunit F [Actinomycetes bacterium]